MTLKSVKARLRALRQRVRALEADRDTLMSVVSGLHNRLVVFERGAAQGRSGEKK